MKTTDDGHGRSQSPFYEYCLNIFITNLHTQFPKIANKDYENFDKTFLDSFLESGARNRARVIRSTKSICICSKIRIPV